MKKYLPLVMVWVMTADARIINVPAGQPTIQSAINAAVHGDTVVVSPGTYFENINFNGKNIVVTSRFYETGDLQFVLSTVINGSRPSHPDTASCVLIVSGENTSAVLQGLTLTEGRGTRWTDEHGAGIYREGGGILVTLSSPTIRYNYIVNNELLNGNAVTSTGGGGIRMGDGGGVIENNVITLNKGMYGGGIVLNYCSGTVIRNNIIAENSVRTYVAGKQGFGGGGLWLGSPKPGDASPNIIENNTIFGNVALDDPLVSFAGGRGGAMVIHSNVKAVVRNNIIWENHSAYPISPIAVLSGDVNVEYNNVMGGFTGKGNITFDPQFADSAFLLLSTSACVDAGDTASQYDDLHFGNETGPSHGTKRNDLGAYGGPKAGHFPPFSRPSLFIPVDKISFGITLPGDSAKETVTMVNFGSKSARIDSVRYTTTEAFSVALTYPKSISVNTNEPVVITWKPLQSVVYQDTMLLYHNSSYIQNPVRVALRGNAVPTPLMNVDLADHNFGSVDVNVASRDTTIYIRNRGTAADSVSLSLNTAGINPPAGVSVTPQWCIIQPHDSQGVTFTFYPRQIIKSFTGAYAPKIRFKSYRGEDTATVEKTMRFRLTGTLSVESISAVPREFALMQNYPNPFNPVTTIAFSIADTGPVQMKMYDMLGRHVETIVNEILEPGSYRISYDASLLSSGIYVYTLRAGNYFDAKKLTVTK